MERAVMRRPTQLRPGRGARVLAALAAAVLLLIGSGCSGDDPAGPADPGADTAPDRSPSAPAGDSDAAGETGDLPESLAFTGNTVSGEPFDASELAGEPAMLWFWAPWCPICHNAAPDVLAAAEQVTVVGIGGLDQDSAMQGFVDRTGTGSFTHLSDPDGQVWQKFEVVTQDTYVLIDANGEVVFHGSLSGSDLRDRAADLATG
jgi:thiol-disulfide isomerase/thioredoxin